MKRRTKILVLFFNDINFYLRRMYYICQVRKNQLYFFNWTYRYHFVITTPEAGQVSPGFYAGVLLPAFDAEVRHALRDHPKKIVIFRFFI